MYCLRQTLSKKLFRTIFVVLIVAYSSHFSCTSYAQAPGSDLTKSIDQLVGSQDVDDTQPGVAILIHQPGKLLFKKGYGLANLSKDEPITTRTMFELASCSKPFTALAVLMLHDRGALSIDQDVRVLLPELPEYRINSPILIRHLLSHTSGIPEYFDFEDVPKRNKSYANNADFLPIFKARMSAFPQEFKAGSRYSYCNSNYLLLALTVERASGKRFEQFVKDEIFEPSGMTDSFIYANPDVPTAKTDCNHALGYEWRKAKGKWKATWGTPPDRNEKELIVGDGSIWTNLEEMLLWDQAVRSRKFLKPETWRLALTPATTNSGKAIEYGLGWMLEYTNASQIESYGHNGCWGGFNTCYWHSNATGRTIVILSNRDDFDPDGFCSELEDLLQRHEK